MLVLSRKVGESLVIGEDITVRVVEVRGDVVRLGIDAPRSVSVQRQELLEELVDRNRESASPDVAAIDALRDALRRRG